MEDQKDLSTILSNIVPTDSTNLHEKSRKRLEFFYRVRQADSGRANRGGFALF